MPTIYCDDCGAIGESPSTIFLPRKLMNSHMKKAHGGKPFGFSIYKD